MVEQAQELSCDNVTKASYLLEDKVVKTPVYQCPRISRIVNEAVSKRCDGNDTDIPELELYLKCENLQTTNSKFRGATYFVSLLSDEVLKRGVIAYSTGNHALSLASACEVASAEKSFPIPVVVVVPRGASPSKVEQIRSHGAKVISFGSSIAECLEMAQNIRRRAGMTLVPPSGHPHYVLGQGTVALEFLDQVQEELCEQDEDCDDAPLSRKSSDTSTLSDASSDVDRPALDIMIMPSAGSGLLAGAAIACQRSGVKVIAAEPDTGYDKLQGDAQSGGGNAQRPGLASLASDLRSIVAEHDWDVIRDSNHVSGVYSATEDDIKAALKPFLEESNMPIEPSGAVALATLMCNPQLHDKIAQMATYYRGSRIRVGVVISGGNTTLDKLVEMFDQKESSRARARVGASPSPRSRPNMRLGLGATPNTQSNLPPLLSPRPAARIPFGSKGPLLRNPFAPMMTQQRQRKQLCAKF